MELLVNVLKILRPVYYKVVPHFSSEARWELVISIKPLIDWLLSNLASFIDPLFGLFENETVSGAFIDMVHSTAGTDPSALTHVVNGTAYVFENEASYNYIGSQFFYVLFEFLTWVINGIADIMYGINTTLPWEPLV